MIQCSECTAEIEEGNACNRCDGVFCPEHWQAHRMSKVCESQITEEDIEAFSVAAKNTHEG